MSERARGVQTIASVRGGDREETDMENEVKGGRVRGHRRDDPRASGIVDRQVGDQRRQRHTTLWNGVIELPSEASQDM